MAPEECWASKTHAAMQAATTRTPNQPLMAHACRSLNLDAGSRVTDRSGLGVKERLDRLTHGPSLGDDYVN